jgi:hypothetical protein
MVAVFSLENLLLNAYRQRFWGFPVFFSADASYCYTKEGMALYPIMTTNIAQQSNFLPMAWLPMRMKWCSGSSSMQ